MDVAMREELKSAGMDEQQAEVLVSHWSQLATKQDLELQLRNLRVSVRENMVGLHENDISIQKELVSLHLAVADIKGGWLVRFMGPALVAIVTGITTGGLALLMSHLLS